LETSIVLSVHVLSVPFYQPVLGFVLRLLRVLGGQRLWARGEEIFHCEFARVSTGMGVWIGAGLIVTDPVSLVSPVLISFFLVQTTPFGCFSPKIAHFRIVMSKVLTTFPSNLDCISKLLRQHCLTDFNNWNNYSNFNLCFIHFWCIRDKKYSFMSCICILFFAIQRHLF
jgi:hypothetical protein